MTTTRVDIEELEPTRSEKLLAVVLAVFLLIAGVWAYQRIDDAVTNDEQRVVLGSPEDRSALARLDQAQARLSEAFIQEATARDDLELSREAYRTALDAGRPPGPLEDDYRRAQRALERARATLRRAEDEVQAARPAADAATRRIDAEARGRQDREELVTFALRLALIAAALAFGYILLARLRNRASRYLPVGFAVVGSAAVLALILASDYITDYVDPFDLGPLLLALFGIVATLLAFYGLQRYLARRLPRRRVRKSECPFCSYPVRETEFCEGCGRAVVAACARCESPRRVGTVHCGACGAT
jgi:hypothetical protein